MKVRIAFCLVAALSLACSTTVVEEEAAFAGWDQLQRDHDSAKEAGFDVTPPKLLKRVNPQPGPDFRLRYSFATAKIQAVIGEDGKVIATRHLEGNPEWGKILAKTVRQWEFAPGTLNGVPTRVLFELSSTFRH